MERHLSKDTAAAPALHPLRIRQFTNDNPNEIFYSNRSIRVMYFIITLLRQ